MARALTLRDGAQIAIIGGGPAGSFFAHFAQKWADRKGLNCRITIFDGKDFLEQGPRGCNLCAGVISRSLEDALEEEGIFLPPGRILSRVDGYILHFDRENLTLPAVDAGKKPIATVFRGNGPRFSRFPEAVSFDDFLLTWAQDRGAEVIPHPVWKVTLPRDPEEKAILSYGRRDAPSLFEADLVVGAFGVNTFLMKEVEKIGRGYRRPQTLRTFQAEFKLGFEEIRRRFGSYIHVYISPSPVIRYATAVPKSEYLTITVVGKRDMKPDLLRQFFALHPLGKTLRGTRPHCFCYPRISISAARRPFSDRLVLIGDASFSRHYKNGIESAFQTARLAARATLGRGIDARSLAEAYYRPAWALIVRDNFYGRLLFRINDLISAVPPLVRSHMSLARSQLFVRAAADIRRILWDMFTGDAAYRDIFRRALGLRLQAGLLLSKLRILTRPRSRWEEADSTPEGNE